MPRIRKAVLDSRIELAEAHAGATLDGGDGQFIQRPAVTQHLEEFKLFLLHMQIGGRHFDGQRIGRIVEAFRQRVMREIKDFFQSVLVRQKRITVAGQFRQALLVEALKDRQAGNDIADGRQFGIGHRRVRSRCRDHDVDKRILRRDLFHRATPVQHDRNHHFIGIDGKIRKPHAVTQGNSALTVDGTGVAAP